MISVSAIDVETGQITIFNEKNTPIEEFYLVVTASSAMPAIFAPVRYKNHLLMDGGVAYNTQVDQAIQRCKEIVEDDSKITIDILGETGNTITNYFRAMEINEYYHGGDSITA